MAAGDGGGDLDAVGDHGQGLGHGVAQRQHVPDRQREQLGGGDGDLAERDADLHRHGIHLLLDRERRPRVGGEAVRRLAVGERVQGRLQGGERQAQGAGGLLVTDADGEVADDDRLGGCGHLQELRVELHAADQRVHRREGVERVGQLVRHPLQQGADDAGLDLAERAEGLPRAAGAAEQPVDDGHDDAHRQLEDAGARQRVERDEREQRGVRQVPGVLLAGVLVHRREADRAAGVQGRGQHQRALAGEGLVDDLQGPQVLPAEPAGSPEVVRGGIGGHNQAYRPPGRRPEAWRGYCMRNSVK